MTADRSFPNAAVAPGSSAPGSSARSEGSPLSGEGLCLDRAGRRILDAVDVALPEGRITAIIGANASGKTTLLRTLSRLQKPDSGNVRLQGRPLSSLREREIARQLAILPQAPGLPEGLTVGALVARGRTPWQGPLSQWSEADAAAVARALERTGMTELARRRLTELSGGQRQRAFIAMVLAQATPLILLDEPTTWLDLPHQIELLNLVRDLNRSEGRTVAMVLHDLNLAARFADHLIAVRQGQIAALGAPDEVITPETVEHIFGLRCQVIADPIHGTPHVIPY